MTLTRRQKELFDYIQGYLEERGYAPTLEEMAEHFGLSSLATIHKHLSNLEEKGLIRRKENHSRAIEIVERRRKAAAVELPMLGRVAAGQPLEAIEVTEKVAVPQNLVRRQNSFVLQVTGESMVDDGILDGDYIVVEPREVARNGETVVALLDGEATVKRFFRERSGRVRLQPANARMQPIFVKDRDLSIRGVVSAVLRVFRR